MSEDKEEEDDEFERKLERQKFIVVIVMGIFGFLAGYSILYDTEKAVKIILMLLGL